MKPAFRRILLVAALLLALLPAAAYLSARDGLVLPAVAVGLAALCSFLAYRGAVMLRRRIDEIGEAGSQRKTRPDR